MSARIKELIAIHQLDTANLHARIEKNAPGTDGTTVAHLVSYIDSIVLPELVNMFDGQTSQEWSTKNIAYMINLAERSLIAGFGYGMQYQDGLLLHKKFLTRFTSKSEAVFAMPDPLETAVKAIFRSVYAAFEQAIEEGVQKKPATSPRKKKASSDTLAE